MKKQSIKEGKKYLVDLPFTFHRFAVEERSKISV
jgi:hypothetical protein